MAILDNGIKMMFFNICWHRLYEGQLPDDKTGSKHGYFEQGHQWGEECYTFLPKDGKLYFHGPVFEEETIRLENLDPQNDTSFVDDILTVFISTDLNMLYDRRCIVGWYNHARVYREFQKYPYDDRRSQTGGTWSYNVITNEEYGFRVEAKDRRNFFLPDGIPTIRKTWFAIDYKTFCKDVYNYIVKCESERKTEKSKNAIKVRRSSKESTEQNNDERQLYSGYSQNIEERLKIEKTAISTVYDFYDAKFYEVKSVEKESKGWDLEARNQSESLKIEVKGTKGDQIYFELTPNEYKKLGEFISQYRIAVVTECLTESPILTIFEVRKTDGGFEGYSNELILTLTEKPGAIGSIARK